MAANEWNQLGLLKIKDIFDAVQDQRQIPGNLTFRSRVNKVPASDADIIGRFLGQAHIADIVADDQRASTYQAGRIKFETNMIPNIKLGRSVTQEDFKRLDFLANNAPANVESMGYLGYFKREAEQLLLGMEQREESMLIGMEIDTFTYSRNGVLFTINWAMPPELKVTPTYGWADTVNSTPFTDITNLALIRKTKYGFATDRVKLSTPAFRLMTKSAEFALLVKNIYINAGQPVPSVPLNSFADLKNLAGRILNMDMEVYDERYWTHPTDGSAPISSPFLPLGKVILDTKANDKNNAIKDFANGVVTESVVGKLTGSVIGLGGQSYGPITYITTPPDLNPPTATWWGVERGMPRKYAEGATAVLDVGAVVDFIDQGITF